MFFAASQLYEHLLQEYENPVLEPFVNTVLCNLSRLSRSVDRRELEQLAQLACDYIAGVIAIELNEPRAQPNCHLRCLTDAVCDERLEGCDVFTLNHDTLIEAALDAAPIEYVDGFGPADGDVAWWQPDVFSQESRTCYLKLHGSLNWVRYGDNLAKVIGPDRDHARNDKGEMLLEVASSPELLVGTFNKIRDYFRPPYDELFAAFRRRMEKLSVLFVSGYSFGDKGINAMVSAWLRAGERNQLIILHEDGPSCIDQARNAIRKLWRDRQSCMHVVPTYLCDGSWADLFQEVNLRDAAERSAHV